MSKKDPRNRERRINLDDLDEKTRDDLSDKLSVFVSNKINDMNAEVSKAAAIYGLGFEMLWELTMPGAVPMWKNPEWHRINLKAFDSQSKPKKEVKKKKAVK